LQNNPLDN